MRGMTTVSGWRVGFTSFRWALALLIAMALFFWAADVTEVPWMERMGANGTGTVIATAWLTAGALLLLVAAVLVYFRDARLPALLGWAASLPLFVALYAVTYSYSYCAIPGC